MYKGHADIIYSGGGKEEILSRIGGGIKTGDKSVTIDMICIIIDKDKYGRRHINLRRL